MRPVDQTLYGMRGNCFSACVASILELPIEAVPSFANDDRTRWAQLTQWLTDRGLAARAIESGAPAPGFTIVGGPSPRIVNQRHACVALDGVVVHDPHPSRDGLPLGVHGYVAIHGRW